MKRYHYIIVLLCYGIFFSCKKQDDFLDKKPNDSFSTPATLKDLELLLSNEKVFNAFTDPAFGSMCSEEYYVLSNLWETLSNQIDRNTYIWTSDIYEGTPEVMDWNMPYQQIYYANTVLDYLPGISSNSQNRKQYNHIQGSALFLRAYALYNLVQVFAMPFDSTTFSSALGVPIKLSSDPNIKSFRPTIKEDYDQIIADARAAVSLLNDFPDKPTQPSKWAAYAFLARLNLAIRDYKQAYLYADSCLNLRTVLTDYQSLTPNTSSLATDFLKEDIYHRTLMNYSVNQSRIRTTIDSNLLRLYEEDDLRLTKLFWVNNGGLRFQGNYDFKGSLYSGLAVDEILLIRAEAAVRTGKIQQGLSDINLLLKYRYKKDSFSPLVISEPEPLLTRILQERRKELLFRGLRWTDLRRLNLEPQHQETLTRVVKNTTYQLLPNDKKYALPIPLREIELTGMPQNQR
ncbi:RagB/SusD family nutrient uptake outer membrane protein [Elizabethkingia anophelis]|uniref:RagB/SusD family nutrient uptake outer membrane protein n=1 Tax=Elizabethkingia anophelis TaxID=1117645 RepID=UPI00136A3424|nr:RagB/SusD family nutrient uptake outer membrane protein [Elizabethkingia anophelis]